MSRMLSEQLHPRNPQRKVWIIWNKYFCFARVSVITVFSNLFFESLTWLACKPLLLNPRERNHLFEGDVFLILMESWHFYRILLSRSSWLVNHQAAAPPTTALVERVRTLAKILKTNFDPSFFLLIIIIIIIIITLSTEVSERSNCRLVPYWREFLGVSGSQTWSDTPFANT